MGGVEGASFRHQLRRIPVFAGIPEAPLELATLENDPFAVLRAELLSALDAGEAEPHAMTLSTVSASGTPSSRVLLCKDVDDRAVYFATSADSRKGRELAETGQAAASFYWKRTGRQMRMVGHVVAESHATAVADFEARGRASQVASLVHTDAAPTSLNEVTVLARRIDAEHPELVPAPSHWRVYALVPSEVELWHGSPDRLHQRVLYSATPDGWRRSLMWP